MTEKQNTTTKAITANYFERIEAENAASRDLSNTLLQHRALRAAIKDVTEAYAHDVSRIEERDEVTDALYMAYSRAQARLVDAKPPAPSGALAQIKELVESALLEASPNKSEVLIDTGALEAIGRAVEIVRPAINAHG